MRGFGGMESRQELLRFVLQVNRIRKSGFDGYTKHHRGAELMKGSGGCGNPQVNDGRMIEEESIRLGAREISAGVGQWRRSPELRGSVREYVACNKIPEGRIIDKLYSPAITVQRA
ncbi:predicted protein [Histoplasma capsulatum var. duboisii H88]|uniref:Predicted protein n=1 Tax=Ajellomyces capsulatus (strain H88) TaxID=544711 RepID=F0U8Y7_AJEC8|nr:predicted protein [Histoplasma capsulatum var. duboisii H88]